MMPATATNAKRGGTSRQASRTVSAYSFFSGLQTEHPSTCREKALTASWCSVLSLSTSSLSATRTFFFSGVARSLRRVLASASSSLSFCPNSQSTRQIISPNLHELLWDRVGMFEPDSAVQMMIATVAAQDFALAGCLAPALIANCKHEPARTAFVAYNRSSIRSGQFHWPGNLPLERQGALSQPRLDVAGVRPARESPAREVAA